MARRKAAGWFSMVRGRIRQSFNKQNLYNLEKLRVTERSSDKVSVLRWNAKQSLRAYHGEHVREKTWQHRFDPHLKSVSFLKRDKRGAAENIKPKPMSLQTWAPLEKRLDVALFRSFFASSPWQARQFIVHGKVKVNNSPIRQPSYELRAGDLFSVDPLSVLTAMGQAKPSEARSAKIDNKQLRRFNRWKTKVRSNPYRMWKKRIARLKAQPEKFAKIKQAKRKKYLTRKLKLIEEQKEKIAGMVPAEERKLLDIAISKGPKSGSINDPTKPPVFFDDQVLNQFAKEYKAIIDKHSNKMEMNEATTKQVDKIVSGAVKRRQEMIQKAYKSKIDAMTEQQDRFERLELKYDPKWAKGWLSKNQEKKLFPWQQGNYGLQDPKKPYFTPWFPRGFMGPWAVYPFHIEVSFDTCHAVYLHDPLAYPGFSEVISPYNVKRHDLAYLHYVSRT